MGALLVCASFSAPVSAPPSHGRTLAPQARLADSPATTLPPPVISVADTSVDEGHSGSTTLAFRVRLTPPASEPVLIQYKLSDGTATAGDLDFEPVSGDTTFAPGEDQVVIEVPVLGDSLLEANERFTLHVHEVQGASPGEIAAIGTIRNDERTSFTSVTTDVRMLYPGTLPPAWGDLDGDGQPDLLMYQNTGDAFVEMPGVRSMLGDGNYHGGAWCDYDRDGDMDAVLMPYATSASGYNFTHLFENTPDGLKEVAPALGMDVVGFGETPSWGDFDADGWPDLFLPFYSHVAPFRSYFFKNLGNGQFLECADSAGLALPNIPAALRPEGVGVADWNGDGSLDIYCASHLLVNDGDGHFTDVRAQVGLPLVFDEGAQFVDHDDDGDLDLYLRTSQGPTLYRNDGGTFSNATAALGVAVMGWEWGDRWADLDSDGDLDLVFFPPGATGRLLLNGGEGTFREDSSFIGVLTGSSLAAFADMDGDGDVDIAAGANGRRFARNRLEQVPRSHTPYLKVRVEDEDGMLTAHGATVRLRSLDDPRHPVQTRIVDGGSGYLGQDEYTITFGGVGSGAHDLEVSYPSKHESRRVVGPATSPLLSAIRPGLAGPQLIVVRPDGQVRIESLVATTDVTPTSPSLSRLWPPIPNPTRSATRFDFRAPAGGRVLLSIHDISGRRLRTLVTGANRSGEASVSWDLRDDSGRDVPAGLYFARMLRDRLPASVQRVVVLR